ncbi:hypothetical protein H1164_03810 [Thermoactinomyces daqus]|uniref:Uncharacterized protein n=1 Tax=Thermoactinomyces daqus TaxID=1329516 RepID=A0A7W1X8H9_9BACL|nr:hypothetical protein [Thermoactinomyces daqus]MBA4542027.1 hypothetical protein [Thermoactinomyces daqus]
MKPTILTGADMFPLKKGDLAILKHTYFALKGDMKPSYSPAYVGFGGKKPREENKSPIYPEQVVAVVRPGWRLSSAFISGDTVEETIEKAWENRKGGDAS